MAHALYEPHIDAAFADEDTSINGYDDDSMLITPRGDDSGKFAGGGGGGDAGVGDGTGGGNGGGLGSLADELAGAMYDSDEEYDDEEAGEGNGYGEGENGWRDGGGGDDDSGGGILTGGGGNGGVGGGGGTTSDYGGSEYGDPEGLTDGISFALEDKIGQIEELSARNKVMMMREEDGEIISTLMEGLQNLPPQSSLESGSTRLITAHSALATHMIHQARTLRNLALSINYSNAPPDDDTLDLLLPLTELIPRPASSALTELASIHALTLSLVSQLSFLSDTLHMARQSSIAANRKLRVAKEACADWKSELEQVERSRRWIEDGDWDAKCRNRNAANVCAEVTGGFEDVCRGFEERLKAQGVVV